MKTFAKFGDLEQLQAAREHLPDDPDQVGPTSDAYQRDPDGGFVHDDFLRARTRDHRARAVAVGVIRPATDATREMLENNLTRALGEVWL